MEAVMTLLCRAAWALIFIAALRLGYALAWNVIERLQG